MRELARCCCSSWDPCTGLVEEGWLDFFWQEIRPSLTVQASAWQRESGLHSPHLREKLLELQSISWPGGICAQGHNALWAGSANSLPHTRARLGNCEVQDGWLQLSVESSKRLKIFQDKEGVHQQV